METMNLPSAPHQRGMALEDLLQWQHNQYQASRRAFIYPNGTQGKMRGGHAILMRSRPDFEGVLTCLGGRHVAFDAKMSASLTYRHHKEQAHQLADLWQIQEAGGIAFLLISVNLDRFFIVYPRYEWAQAQIATIRLDQMTSWEGCEVQVSGNYRLPDWLSVIEREEVRR